MNYYEIICLDKENRGTNYYFRSILEIYTIHDVLQENGIFNYSLSYSDKDCSRRLEEILPILIEEYSTKKESNMLKEFQDFKSDIQKRLNEFENKLKENKKPSQSKFNPEKVFDIGDYFILYLDGDKSHKLLQLVSLSNGFVNLLDVKTGYKTYSDRRIFCEYPIKISQLSNWLNCKPGNIFPLSQEMAYHYLLGNIKFSNGGLLDLRDASILFNP